jgi:hypothetical protein
MRLMKFDVLRSVGHNIAHSLSSGVSLIVGEYEFYIYGEAAKSPAGYMDVDFLTGTTAGMEPSPALARVIVKLAAALPGICERQGVSVLAFRRLEARYIGAWNGGLLVKVETCDGRSAQDDYSWQNGARPRLPGPRGGTRRKRGCLSRAQSAHDA